MARLIHLARFQVRILLGRPIEERRVSLFGRMRTVWLWRCGCSGVELEHARFSIVPCQQDGALLPFVSEDDERAHFEALCQSYTVAATPSATGKTTGGKVE